MNLLSRSLIAAIHWYQKNISAGTGRRCKYQPTCSAYALESIEVHGALKGTILASWRLLRCNPWSKGGVDWVPSEGMWPTAPLNYEQLMEYRQLHEQGEREAAPDHSDLGGAAHTVREEVRERDNAS